MADFYNSFLNNFNFVCIIYHYYFLSSSLLCAPVIVFVIVGPLPSIEHEHGGELESNLFAHSWRVCWRWIKSEAERALN